MENPTALPAITDRADFQRQLDQLRIREKAHTREGDAIAAARRRLPMVEVDGNLPLTGGNGAATLLDAFEGRSQLIAHYFMWKTGKIAAEQCEGCTWMESQVRELSYLHSRDITLAVLSLGPYDEGRRYRDFMGWDVPWYSAREAKDRLFAGRHSPEPFLSCFVRAGDRVFETYWTAHRGVEAMDASLGLMDLTVFGRQEKWEDSPAGWPQPWPIGVLTSDADLKPASDSDPALRRPIAQWPRIAAGRSDAIQTTDVLQTSAADDREPTGCCH